MYLPKVSHCLDRIFSHTGRPPVLMGGIVWQAWCSHECVCPTGTKPGASAQVTQRGSGQAAAALLGTQDFTGCPENNVLGQLSRAWQGCASERAAQLNRVWAGRDWERHNSRNWAAGLYKHMLNPVLLVCPKPVGCLLWGWGKDWTGCPGGCVQVECAAVECDVLMLPELWHFHLVLSSGGPCNGIWQ